MDALNKELRSMLGGSMSNGARSKKKGTMSCCG
jgi:hypothetical protein